VPRFQYKELESDVGKGLVKRITSSPHRLLEVWMPDAVPVSQHQDMFEASQNRVYMSAVLFDVFDVVGGLLVQFPWFLWNVAREVSEQDERYNTETLAAALQPLPCWRPCRGSCTVKVEVVELSMWLNCQGRGGWTVEVVKLSR